MLVRSLGVVVLTVGLATPAIAQQAGTAQEKIRPQIEAFMNRWMDAYNHGDGQALSALASPDSFGVGDKGVLSGDQRIERAVQNEATRGGRVTGISVDQVRVIGRNAAVAAGPYVVTYSNPRPLTIHGTWMQVLERQRDGWKSVAASYTPLNALTSPTAGNPQPTAGSSVEPGRK